MNVLRCSTYPYKSQGHLKPKSPAAVSEKSRPSEKAAGGEGFAQRLPGQSAGSKDSPRGSIEEWWMLSTEAWLHPCSQWGFTCLISRCFSFFWYIHIIISYHIQSFPNWEEKSSSIKQRLFFILSQFAGEVSSSSSSSSEEVWGITSTDGVVTWGTVDRIYRKLM